MKHLKNDHGYALFIAVLIIVLFSVLAVSLMTIVMSGAKKTEVREDITQATELSEKGLQHITNQINKELEDALGDNGIPRSEFAAKLTAILNQYKCDNEGGLHSFEKTTGDYDVCIDSFDNVKDENGNINDLRKLVTFRSIGEVNGRTKQVLSDIEIGAGSVPETLKYVLGSNIESRNPRNGEGNILIHGGADIRGDMKVDGHLITYDHGTAAYGWIPSILPRALPVKKSISPKLVLGKNMYRIISRPSTGSERNHNLYLSNDNFNSRMYSRETNPENLFDSGYAPQIVKRNPVPNNIKIKEHRDSYYFNQNTPGVQVVSLGEAARFSDYTNMEKPVFPRIKVCSWFNCKEYYDREFTLYNNNRFKKLASGNDVTIRYGDHFFDEGLYVRGNLMVGNNRSTDNPNERDNISLEGPMYIDGNVTIQGANLESHSIMYVDGDVTIRFSSINGKKLKDGSTGTLIVFATGNIYLANNSVNSDTPSTIKGYFYSEQFFEMYGVGSNIRVEGGISAKRIVLNSIRGRSSNRSFPGAYYYSGSYYEGVNGQKNRDSRLQVVYDIELIENYLKLNPPEPVIYDVDPPQLIDRK